MLSWKRVMGVPAIIGPVAQLVEHRTFNAVVAGSIPARLTIEVFCNEQPTETALPLSLYCHRWSFNEQHH